MTKTKCLLKIENPKCIQVYEKGVKIEKQDGTISFLICKKGSKGVYTEVCTEELTRLVFFDNGIE